MELANQERSETLGVERWGRKIVGEGIDLGEKATKAGEPIDQLEKNNPR